MLDGCDERELRREVAELRWLCAEMARELAALGEGEVFCLAWLLGRAERLGVPVAAHGRGAPWDGPEPLGRADGAADGVSSPLAAACGGGGAHV